MVNETGTIEERLNLIEQRNTRVDANKRWETSWIRRIAVAVLTYLVICLFLYEIEENQIFLKALVPMLGFILSTISLRFLRNLVGY